MSDEEFKKYVELIMSMGLDFLQGTLERRTFVNNLDMILESLKKRGK